MVDGGHIFGSSGVSLFEEKLSNSKGAGGPISTKLQEGMCCCLFFNLIVEKASCPVWTTA